MTYKEKLSSIITKNQSHLVVGLDTDLGKIPEFLREAPNPIYEFNCLIVEATKDIAAGYKLNTAFYERYGDIGLFGFKQTLLCIPPENITICDAKRGDIDNTDEMYAATYFDNYKCDSITVNPYLGEDSVRPFLNRKKRLSYVLLLTSNPGSEDFQRLKAGDKYLYEHVLEKSLKWNKNDNLGYVIGANYTDVIKKVSSSHPEIPLLIPGIGAQKHDLKSVVSNLNNRLFVINSSRGIIYAGDKSDDAEAYRAKVRKAALKLRDEINSNLK